MTSLGEKILGGWRRATWAVHDLVYDIAPDWLRQKINHIDRTF